MDGLFLPKKGESFKGGVFIVMGTVFLFSLAFLSETRLTGLAASDEMISGSVLGFRTIEDMRTLPEGNYFIDGKGYVYWLDDDSRPVIAKATYIFPKQQNRYIYIADDGTISYIG